MACLCITVTSYLNLIVESRLTSPNLISVQYCLIDNTEIRSGLVDPNILTETKKGRNLLNWDTNIHKWLWVLPVFKAWYVWNQRNRYPHFIVLVAFGILYNGSALYHLHKLFRKTGCCNLFFPKHLLVLVDISHKNKVDTSESTSIMMAFYFSEVFPQVFSADINVIL